MLPLTTDQGIISSLMNEADGLLFTGGQDVSPALYREEKEACCEQLCTPRDDMESLIFPMALKQDKPMLGICRGFQLFNVLCGGTLYQDLPTQRPSDIVHLQDDSDDKPTHCVTVVPGSLLHQITGEKSLNVNSFHHQGVRDLADIFDVAALSPDGLTECIVRQDKSFVMAVQWHPEFLFSMDPANLNIFKAFVAACRK